MKRSLSVSKRTWSPCTSDALQGLLGRRQTISTHRANRRSPDQVDVQRLGPAFAVECSPLQAPERDRAAVELNTRATSQHGHDLQSSSTGSCSDLLRQGQGFCLQYKDDRSS